jgi:hypothetical protein
VSLLELIQLHLYESDILPALGRILLVLPEANVLQIILIFQNLLNYGVQHHSAMSEHKSQ